MLIAVDETEGSDAILSVVRNMVRPPESVVLLHVQHLESKSIIDIVGKAGILESLKGTRHKEARDRKSERILHFYRRELENGGLISVKTVIRDGVPSEEILKVAQEEGVDLVITGHNQKGESMHNQKGEVVTGAMVVLMVVMMLFGGMHLMHGDHRHVDDHDRSGHKNDQQHDQKKEGLHHMHNDEGDHPGSEVGK